jgi:acyl homoserine lactone synthase
LIECLTTETAHLFGDALVSQYRLRHRAFTERQEYQTFSLRGMEYDRYDTPASTYLVWRDDQRIVRGASRLNPTDRPFMLGELWPEMVTKKPLPSSWSVWEGTRFCVDKEFGDAALRRRIISEVVCSYLEYGLLLGMDSIVGVMPPLIWRSVFVKSGWDVEHLGEMKTFQDGSKVIAGELVVSAEKLKEVRRRTGLHENLLITKSVS